MDKNKDIVRYNSDANDFPWELTAVEMDYFATICMFMRGRFGKETTIPLSEIKRISGRQNTIDNERFTKQLIKMNESLARMVTTIKVDSTYITFGIFHRFQIDEKMGTVKVQLHEDLIYILNNFERYTTFSLPEFISLKTRYSKTMFRYLNAWRQTGIWSLKVSEFRKLMDVPKKYDMHTIINKVIKPSMKELKQYFPDLEVEYVKEGLKIVRITFKFNNYDWDEEGMPF